MMRPKQKISRRNFLKTGTGIAASAPLAPAIIGLSANDTPCAPSPLNKWPGRVVLNYNNMQTATPTAGNAASEATIKKMVDDSIKLLTGQSTVSEAWKSIFPSISLSIKIAIKINILNPSVPPHPFVVMGITEGLQQMDFGGQNFPAANITIYDTNNGSSMDSAGFTATRFPGITRIKDSMATHTDAPGARDSRYTNSLYNADYLINVPGMRGHSSWAGSVTLGFKSHYGTYPPSYHDSSNGPGYLRDINCTGPVYNKTALTVCGAIYGLRIGHGPSGSPDTYTNYATIMDPSTSDARPNTVIMSTDPVTAEFQMYKVMRIRDNLGYPVSSLPSYLRASGGVAGSLSTVYNIGILNEASMDYREIINEEVTALDHPLHGSEISRKGALLVSPNPAKAFVRVDVTVPAGYRKKSADLEIFGTRGRLVRKITVPVLGARNRAVWNGTDARGRQVTPGKYVVKADLDGRVLTQKITLVR